MISLTNILEDIKNDFVKEQYRNSIVLTRRFVLAKGNVISVSMNKNTDLCGIGIDIPDETTYEELNSLPKWKGMEGKDNIVTEKTGTKRVLSFEQLEGYDQTIFVNVMKDVCDNLEFVDKRGGVSTIKYTLQKWSVFFQFEKDYVLSANVQQGLYSELTVLEKMIKKNGNKALAYWTGYNSESHDFYIGKDAVEIKSSSAKGPEKVKISNEYQLDDSGVMGLLYLLYLSIKKSEVDGEMLPEIVERIMIQLDCSQKEMFKEKLLKVGYVYSMPELYTYHFRVREESCFMVKGNFPRITPKNIHKGIGAVEYVVSLDACRSYMIEIESFYKGVDYQ
ncbi:MAG: PD-(D/E)XK motif protein [Lachnospira sp.]|jgi:hypothetical protein